MNTNPIRDSPLKRSAQRSFAPSQKSPFLCVNRSLIRYDFRAGEKPDIRFCGFLSGTIWTQLKKFCAALCINCVNGLVKNQPVKKWFTILSQTSRVRSDRGGQTPPSRPSPYIRHCGHKHLDTATGASLKEGYDACSCLLWNWWKKSTNLHF